MLAQVKKWGNSQGVRLPKQILKKSYINVGDSVDITVEHGQVIIKAVTVDPRGRYDLKELMAKIAKGSAPEESGFGGPVGDEVW